MTDNDPKLTDGEVQRVLARALEIQSESPHALTVTQMREIASDMGIPVSAVDQALSEYRSADAAQPSSIPAAEVVPNAPEPRSGFGRLVIVSLALVGAAAVLMIVISLIVRS